MIINLHEHSAVVRNPSTHTIPFAPHGLPGRMSGQVLTSLVSDSWAEILTVSSWASSLDPPW